MTIMIKSTRQPDAFYFMIITEIFWKNSLGVQLKKGYSV